MRTACTILLIAVTAISTGLPQEPTVYPTDVDGRVMVPVDLNRDGQIVGDLELGS